MYKAPAVSSQFHLSAIDRLEDIFDDVGHLEYYTRQAVIDILRNEWKKESDDDVPGWMECGFPESEKELAIG